MNKYKFVKSPDSENDDIRTKNDILVATSFTRIVHGGRGNYVEFSTEEMCVEDLHIPSDQKWRLNNGMVYYIEFRTTDNIKVYFQIKSVDYADYKAGMWYISPISLKGFEKEEEK